MEQFQLEQSEEENLGRTGRRSILEKLGDTGITIITSLILALMVGLTGLEFKRAIEKGVTNEWRKKIESHLIKDNAFSDRILSDLSSLKRIEEQINTLKEDLISQKSELLQTREEIYQAMSERTQDRFTARDWERERKLLILEIKEMCNCAENEKEIKRLNESLNNR